MNNSRERSVCFSTMAVFAVAVIGLTTPLRGSPPAPTGADPANAANPPGASEAGSGFVSEGDSAESIGMGTAFISGRAPIGATVASATDGNRGTAAPRGRVAGTGTQCTCDLDCGDGNACTDDYCNAVTGACDHVNANAGTLCGGTNFCNQDTCDAVGGCTGTGGGSPCDLSETCNEATDHCDSCATAAECTAYTDPINCRTGGCVGGRCEGVSDCTDDEFCDTDGIANGICTLDTNGRCCADINTCAATALADCGAGSGNYAHQMPFNDCTCPKYSSGINDNAGADLIRRLSATEQPCTLFNRVGDDYAVANGSYLLLDTFRFVGGIDIDGTGDGTVVFEFYDASTTPPILVFATAVQFDPAADRGDQLWQITLTTPTVIPPVGYFVMRPGAGSGETVNLLSANAFGMEGLNDPTLMWANDGPRAYLSPDDPDIMAFELVGTKIADPLGGCCDPSDIAPCTDTTQWVCDELGFNWVEGVLCVSDPCGAGACCAGPVCTITSQAGCGGDWAGPGTSCDPNCCTQPATGADMCDGVTVHQIVVPAIGSPAVVTTITGDATNATDGICGDGAGGGSGTPCRTNNAAGWTCDVPGETCEANGECTDFSNDPLWWEAFHIDAGANVTIDYCCTFQGEGEGGTKEVRYIVLSDGCDPATSSCGNSTFRSADMGGCGDGNPSDIWNELPAGTWYIPIYADNHCSGSTVNCFDDAGCPAGETCVSGATPYQLHITVEPLPLGGCCTIADGVTQGHCVGGVQAGQACPPADCTGGTCVMEMAPICTPLTDAPTCAALGGISIDNTTCTGAPCDLGSCCVGAEAYCEDVSAVGITYFDCNLLGGQYYGGVRCIADDPCPACVIGDAAHCQLNDGGFIVQNDRMLGVRWADDFMAATSGPIDHICWWPCWYNPNVPEECSAPGEHPPDDFIVRFYADAGGIPGEEIGPPGGQGLPPDITTVIEGSRCSVYSATLATPPIVTAGECYWIEITGMGDPATGCTVYWHNNNSSGNSYSLNDQDGVYSGDDIQTSIGDEASDMSFCVDSGIVPGSCEHRAVCCWPGPPWCEDDVLADDCIAGAGVFKPGETCGPATGCHPLANCNCTDERDLNSPGYCNGGGIPCSFDFSNEGCFDPRPGGVNCQVTPGGPIEASEIGSTMWYTWTPDASGPVRITMCDDADYDAILAVYEGGTECSTCPVNEANTLVCGDDTCGITGGPPVVEFDATGGDCYFVSVGGWNGEQGSGVVTIESAVPNCGLFAETPLPDARFGIDESANDTSLSCTTTADCLVGINANSEVECIAGTCYVRENKYLSVDPNPANAGTNTARRVSLDLGGGATHVLGWMDTPIVRTIAGPEDPSQLQSLLSDVPVYLDWSTLDSVHLGDCEISPGYAYVIESIVDTCDIFDESAYSEPLTLATVERFGDVTGGVVRQPPDRNRNFKDINAVVRGFQSVQKEPKVWLDLQGSLATPSIPNFSDISFTDINHAVAGFQGGGYPYEAPCDCPGQACP